MNDFVTISNKIHEANLLWAGVEWGIITNPDCKMYQINSITFGPSADTHWADVGVKDVSLNLGFEAKDLAGFGWFGELGVGITAGVAGNMSQGIVATYSGIRTEALAGAGISYSRITELDRKAPFRAAVGRVSSSRLPGQFGAIAQVDAMNSLGVLADSHRGIPHDWSGPTANPTIAVPSPNYSLPSSPPAIGPSRSNSFSTPNSLSNSPGTSPSRRPAGRDLHSLSMEPNRSPGMLGGRTNAADSHQSRSTLSDSIGSFGGGSTSIGLGSRAAAEAYGRDAAAGSSPRASREPLANYPGESPVFFHVMTGSNLAGTDRLMKAAGAQCVGGSYVV